MKKNLYDTCRSTSVELPMHSAHQGNSEARLSEVRRRNTLHSNNPSLVRETLDRSREIVGQNGQAKIPDSWAFLPSHRGNGAAFYMGGKTGLGTGGGVGRKAQIGGERIKVGGAMGGKVVERGIGGGRGGLSGMELCL